MNENESKTVTIKLDARSIDILKKVDSLHRESMINLGLALVSKTQYYNTLCGNTPNNLEDIANIGLLDGNTSNLNNTQGSVQETKPIPKQEVKKSTSWDDF